MKLWLDDLRDMPDDYDVHVETVEDAIMFLEEYEVEHIGFDHDLGYEIDGKERNGYHLACWIEAEATKGLPRLTWSIQSDNPVGRDKIDVAMNMATRYWRAIESMCKSNETFPYVLKHFKKLPETMHWYTHRDPVLGDKTPAQLILDNEQKILFKFIADNFIEAEDSISN